MLDREFADHHRSAIVKASRSLVYLDRYVATTGCQLLRGIKDYEAANSDSFWLGGDSFHRRLPQDGSRSFRAACANSDGSGRIGARDYAQSDRH
jgi:hypothetical protein